MATLPDLNLTYEISKSTEANVLEAEFGDGYSQRAANGINSLKDSWDLEWVLNDTDKDTLIAFFEARGGHESFGWTPSSEDTEKMWTCRSWNRSYIESDDVFKITATLKQCYDK